MLIVCAPQPVLLKPFKTAMQIYNRQSWHLTGQE